MSFFNFLIIFCAREGVEQICFIAFQHKNHYFFVTIFCVSNYDLCLSDRTFFLILIFFPLNHGFRLLEKMRVHFDTQRIFLLSNFTK